MVLRKEDSVRTKGAGASLTPELLGNTNTGAMDRALLEMYFSICAMTGPQVELSLRAQILSQNPFFYLLCLNSAFRQSIRGTKEAHHIPVY